MNVLVTGALGFLGHHLCKALLAGGHDVWGLDNLQTGSMVNRLLGVPVVKADIKHVYSTSTAFPGVRFDRIYHLACPASPPAYQKDPLDTLLTGFQGTERALDIGYQHEARVLIASTSEVYGDPLEHPQREEYRGNVSTVGPRACYDEGKRAAETLVVCYEQKHKVGVRLPRIHNTYGPRMAPADGRAVPNFVTQALAGQPLTVYGTGSQTRSLCYVDDLISGLIRLMELDYNPGPMNLGNPTELTVLELARAVNTAVGVDPDNIVFKPLPQDDPLVRCPDISKAKTLLAWNPTVSLGEGLQRTVEDFRKRLEMP